MADHLGRDEVKSERGLTGDSEVATRRVVPKERSRDKADPRSAGTS